MPHPTRHAPATSVAASTTFSRSSRRRTRMKTIDIHAHLVPKSLGQAADAGREWYGFRHEPGDGLGSMLGGGRRTSFSSPKVRFTTEERLKDMDAQGVDVQVVSIHTPFFGYHLDPAQGRALAREVNDEIAGMVRQWPQRFAGLATLPVQDVKAAIDQLERAVTAPSLLRPRRRQREGAPLPDRRGRRRPGGARQRLALRAVASLPGQLGAGPEDPDAGRERKGALAQSRVAAEAVGSRKAGVLM